MKFVKKVQKALGAVVRSYGTNHSGCGESGYGVNPKGKQNAAANYNKNQK